MRIAILVKQIPAFEEMALGADGSLVRDGVALEMSAYCRRAVAQGVALARSLPGSTTTVFTLGPPSALDVIREAVGWGVDEGALISDSQFARSDTVATAHTIAAALDLRGPFDLVLVGRNSLDADTGQVGPGIAEILGWGFLPSVKALTLDDRTVSATCEEDDGESTRIAVLPLVVATAERLIEPCKVRPDGWPAISDPRLETLTARDLGKGPWGASASPTSVGELRVHESARTPTILDGPIDAAVASAVEVLRARGALERHRQGDGARLVVGDSPEAPERSIAVVVEPDRLVVARELLGEANDLARRADASVVAIVVGESDPGLLATWGADHVEALVGTGLEARAVAHAVSSLAGTHRYWSILFPSTAWGREVAGRVSARLRAGLTGDAIVFDVEQVGELPALVAWKSALGGQLIAAIRSSTEPQMATVRPGVLTVRAPRAAPEASVTATRLEPIAGVTTVRVERLDDVEDLERATHVVGVGGGVPLEEYAVIESFAATLDATLAGTRRVTDQGWLPRARQIGITGRSIQPALYVAVAISGKFNHTVGVRAAGTIVAVNADRSAPIFDACDIGIVGDWREVIPRLDAAIRARR